MKQSLGVSYKAIYPDGPAITKLWFGKKFMIWKFKDLLSGVPLLAQQLASKSIKHRLKSLKEDDLFFTAVKYIVKNKIDSIKVEVLFRSTQPHELLLKETSHLNNVFGNDECLNQNSEPYLPTWISGDKKEVERIKDSFHFTLKGKHKASIGSVVKLIVGDKNMIWKFKSIKQGCIQLNKSFNVKIRNGCQEFDLFYKLIEHAVKNNINKGEVHVLFTSPDIAELYKKEKEILKQKDPDRLNINKVPYVPNWMKAFKIYKPKTFTNG